MNKILDKRNSLERFIREQTLGPGINGYKYVDISNEALTEKSLSLEEPIHYCDEVIDIVPAAVYSTGILFPEDRTGTCGDGVSLDNNELTNDDAINNDDDSQDNSHADIDSEESVDLNQMFPRVMGLSCCLHKDFLDIGTLEFKISCRYYIKLDREKTYKYGLLCEVKNQNMSEFISSYKLDDFSIKKINQNDFLLLSKVSSDKITNIKANIRNIQKQIADKIYDKTKDKMKLDNLTREGCNLSNLKSSIYYDLKSKITDESLRSQLYDITQEIEEYESILDHLKNLLDVHSGGYGLWQSVPIERTIKLENIKFENNINKLSFLHNKPYSNANVSVISEGKIISNELKDIFRKDLDEQNEDYASLSVNVQLSRDSRKNNNQIFLKIQLINSSVAFDETKYNDNRYYSTFNELVNMKSFFGVKISLENKLLIPYSNHEYRQNKDGLYSEDTVTRFIYDQYKDFAIGHGCSVKWSNSDETNKVETEYLPECETPDIEPIPRDKSKDFIKSEYGLVPPLYIENTKSQEFKWLSIFSDATDLDIISGLNEFVDAYGNWIATKKEQYNYSHKFSKIAEQELNKCEIDFNRMKSNIKYFLTGKENERRLHSFRLMNAVMFMQLWHSVNAKKEKFKQVIDEPSFQSFNFDFYKSASDKLFSATEPAGWRAFQLAFIILNLDGIFKLDEDTDWEKRNNWVDLVWFPTGGGKTEAYLGLIALTIINRRKEFPESGGGTAVIMRYTLRLLTMQQFQRATMMIMALELLRRWGNLNLGEEPIYIGLWVGNSSIPNTNEDLKKEFVNLNSGKINKIPFSSCPWCNSKIEAEITTDSKPNTLYLKDRLHLTCKNAKCSFHYPTARRSSARYDQMPIPVCLSDETIYQHPPALLFGTVDKFAQLAHKVNGENNGRKSDSRRLFGRGNWEVGKPKKGYLPPDLIIQDELHLLLGPLGSAVALFEAAINQLCTREDGTRPKIISSTATTRNTQVQIAALFDRTVNLFPKLGVECDDSYFAFYKRQSQSHSNNNAKYISKRKYIGVLPTGRTQIWMQMRLAAIIMTHRAIFELKELGDSHPIDFKSYKNFEKAMDYYHTVISYFGSLKEVGKTQSQVQTYILKELRRVFSRVIRPQKLMHSIYTYGPIQESELTGRLSGEEVKNELKKVETKWEPENRFASIKNDETTYVKIPPEFVVATNMISVGIDVSRFNTIIINSMPRNTAEYIQASSRVARNDYGIVLTVHHPFRARDISHYEKFIEFHEKMYSYVEPISITPFTQKAVERYMGLYLSTIIRHKTRFVNRNSASEILSLSENDFKIMIDELTKYFSKRKDRMNKFELSIQSLFKEENFSLIKSWIESALKEWREEAKKSKNNSKAFVFNNKTKSQEQLYVDIEEYDENIHSKKWQIPMSLRVIEPEAAIRISSK